MSDELFTTLKLAVAHDSGNPGDRTPLGALPGGSMLTVRLRAMRCPLTAVRLILFDDQCEQQRDMQRVESGWECGLSVPVQPGVLWYYFQLQAGEHIFYYGATADSSTGLGQLYHDRPPAFQLSVYAADFIVPDWLRRGVMYQIFPDRFARSTPDQIQRGLDYHLRLGRQLRLHDEWTEPVDWRAADGCADYYPNDFFGGTLSAICDRLPYLHELGVTVLYLNPIFEADSNHRYNTADYLRVDPLLGQNEDLSRLCEQARGFGMRVLLDGVFSHTGADSRYFDRYGRYADSESGAYQSRTSPYASWYDFTNWPQEYRCWWGFDSLPEVRESDPGWQDFIISAQDSVMRQWLDQGVAGFRLDVADELPDEVLRLMRQATRQTKADSVLLGEVWEDPTTKQSYGQRRQYALGEALDSVMNYPLRNALVDFALGKADSHRLRALLLSQRLNYPLPLYYSLMNLLSSHDIERIRTALATRLDARQLTREQQAGFHVSPTQDERGRMLQYLLAVIQFSLPGCPCVYYGDEQGMQGFLDPFNRAPFQENEQSGLLREYRLLSHVRQQNDAFSVGALAVFAPRPGVAAVLRCLHQGRDVFNAPGENGAFLTVVNREPTPQRFVLDLYAEGNGLTAEQLHDLRSADYTAASCLLSGAKASIDSGLLLSELPPYSARLFEFCI